MNHILAVIKKYIPRKLFRLVQPAYHFVMGYIAALVYGFPGKKMIVIGVTGTTGKTTTIYIMAKLLMGMGYRVGYTSTAMLGDGKREWLNDKKMTMLGRFQTQKMLKDMCRNGCAVAIVETTSEGIMQFRHRFINYDILVFTGLYPEHIEAHGSFENYKQAKLRLFRHLEICKHKVLKGKKIPKAIVANIDDDYAREFLNHRADIKVGYGVATDNISFASESLRNIKAQDIQTNEKGVRFSLYDTDIQTRLVGEFNVTNMMAAVGVAEALDHDVPEMKNALESITGVPGRMERIEEGQDFTVLVDYAFEPRAMRKLYETLTKIRHKKRIHVLGATGGGRDKDRRKILGEMAGEFIDVVVVTNEDPYDDDPMEIIQAVAEGVKNKGKIENENLFIIRDRREAIRKALSLAQSGDVVLITGKGCEQGICVAEGRIIPWDDRQVAREELIKL